MKISRSQVKYLQSLRQKKYRQKYESFLAEGRKVVIELIGNKRLKIKALYGLESWMAEHSHMLKDLSVPLYEVSQSELRQIGSFKTPDAVCAEFNFMVEEEPSHSEDGWMVYLDNLNDPGNAGSIIRSADWFGVKHVYFSPGSVDIYNPKTIQATMGSLGRVPLSYRSHFEVRSQWPHYDWFHADLTGPSLHTINFPSHGILVIGSESHGISSELIALRHETVSIDRANDSKAESLNASVAAAVILSYILK